MQVMFWLFHWLAKRNRKVFFQTTKMVILRHWSLFLSFTICVRTLMKRHKQKLKRKKKVCDPAPVSYHKFAFSTSSKSIRLTLVLATTPQTVFATIFKNVQPRDEIAPDTLKFILPTHFSELILNVPSSPGRDKFSKLGGGGGGWCNPVILKLDYFEDV